MMLLGVWLQYSILLLIFFYSPDCADEEIFWNLLNDYIEGKLM